MPAIPTTGTGDAVSARVRSDLKIFTDWLHANGQDGKGLIGEFGIPGSSNPGVDLNYDSRWDYVMQQWFLDANAANLHTTNWVTAEWNVDLRSYRNKTGNNDVLDTNTTTAAVLEKNLSAGSYLRGVNMAGADFSDYGPNGSMNLSTAVQPGAGYYYPQTGDYAYLYSRGVRLIRLPFRWERLQKTLLQPLDTTELGYITTAISRANAAGLKVLIDMHNYGRYDTAASGNTTGNTNGVIVLGGNAPATHNGQTVGGTTLNCYLDVWTRIVTALTGKPGLWAYGIMNEPHDLGSNATWQDASRQVVEKIRLLDQTTRIAVPGYTYATVPGWLSENGTTAWLTEIIPTGQTGAGSARNTDPLILWEGHHYWDNDHSGSYNNTYAAEITNATNMGFASYTATANGPVPPVSSQTGYRTVFKTDMADAGAFDSVNVNTNTITIPFTGVGNPTNSLKVIGSTTSDPGDVVKDMSSNPFRSFSFDFYLPSGQTLSTSAPFTIAHLWSVSYGAQLAEVRFTGNGSGYSLGIVAPPSGAYTYNQATTPTVLSFNTWHNINLVMNDNYFQLYIDNNAAYEVRVAGSNSGLNFGPFALGKFYSTSYTGPMYFDNVLAGGAATYDAPNPGPAPFPITTNISGLVAFI